MQIIDMNRSGDTRHEFDVAEQAGVDAAMEKFRELIGQGKLAYSVDETGKGQEVLRANTFDPQKHTKVIFQPQNIGG